MTDIAAIYREVLEEAWSGGSQEVFERYSPDFTLVGPMIPNGVHGADGERERIAGFRHAFPDLRFTVDEQVVEGNRVVTRWTVQGTHEGEFAGIAPTGRSFPVGGVSIATFSDDGLLTGAWTMWDVHGLLTALRAPA